MRWMRRYRTILQDEILCVCHKVYDIPKAPSGRELSSERMTEGERVTMKIAQI